MTIQTSKTLGGIGALLLVISPFSFVAGVFGSLLGLVGLILVLIAMKGLADHYMDAGIFNNSLYGVIVSIIGGVVFAAALIMTAVSFFRDIGIDFSSDWSDPAVFSGVNWTQGMILDSIMTHIGVILISFVILWIFAIVAAILYRKSLTALSNKTGIGLFGTAGLLLLIGAVLAVIAIGFIIIWIALILLTVAFFQIREEPAQPMTPS
jgi:uncharacterized membrane protein